MAELCGPAAEAGIPKVAEAASSYHYAGAYRV